MLHHLFATAFYPIVVIVPLWVVFRLIINTRSAARSRFNLKRELLLFVLCLYAIVVGTLTLLPQMDLSGAMPLKSSVNLVPLVRLYEKLQEARTCPVNMCIYNWLSNVLGNIALFVPLGLLLPLAVPRLRSAAGILLVAFVCSTTIEVLQHFLKNWHIYRFSDIDDVILNNLGALVGFWFYKMLPAEMVELFAKADH